MQKPDNTGTIDTSTLDALKRQLDAAKAAVDAEIGRVHASAIAEVRRLVAAAGLTHADVFPPKPATGTGRKLGPVAPKYRNPADATQTWSGRGLKPTWLAAAIEAGATLDSFLIEQPAPAAADPAQPDLPLDTPAAADAGL